MLTNRHCLTDTPLRSKDLNTIYEALYDARFKWEHIGKELGVDLETLVIFSWAKDEDNDRLKEMLRFRLQFAVLGLLTWKQILDSLRAPVVAHDDVANKLEQRLSE